MILRDALMTVLTNFGAGRVAILNPSGSSGPIEAQMPYQGKGYPPHSHVYPELVQLTEGRARLKLANSAIELDENTAYLVQPGTIHSETFYRVRQSYRLLWTVFNPAGMSVFISQYSYKGGFSGQPERLIGLTTNREMLWKLTTSAELARDQLARMHFQAMGIELFIAALGRMDKPTSTAIDHKKALVDQVCGYLEHHYREDVSIDSLAQMARCTPNYLNTVFRKVMGQPIHRFILQRRMEVAREWLERSDKPIKEISFQLGFRDPLYFSRLFRKRFGQSPNSFRG